MRCFLAVDIPEELKEKICKVQEELRGLDTKLVEKGNLHFTLKFLGEIDGEKMDAVAERINTIKMPPFSVLLKGTGFFPDKNFIRVVWLGAESKEFLNLHIAVESALAGLFKKEKPVPHLTLARVRTQKYKKELLEFGARHEKDELGSFMVEKMKLKKSTLSGKGPAYEDVGVFSLAN